MEVKFSSSRILEPNSRRDFETTTTLNRKPRMVVRLTTACILGWIIVAAALGVVVDAWTIPSPMAASPLKRLQRQQPFTKMGTTTTTTTLFSDPAAVSVVPTTSDDDEYEYVEYDALTEAEFIGSEWLVGTNWDRRTDLIEETWVRLVTSEDGRNVCYWGDNSEGKWSLDTTSQFLSISKENFFGKQIWAGVVDDFYFVQGTVRGWTYVSTAQVLGQWQARRLGVDKEEAGTAPWFETTNDEDDTTTSSASSVVVESNDASSYV